MPDSRFVVAAHGSGSVEQGHKPILPNIPHLASALFHTFKDILDVGGIDFHVPLVDDFGGHLFSADG